MLLRETGFTFNGLHSRDDMGLQYVEKDGHTIIPRIERNAYEIAGVSGTVLMPGETWKTIPFEGTLYPLQERATQAEAQQMLRWVAAWLTAGRSRLIFDYEPGVYYLAELSGQSKWSLKNWFGGELPVQFEAQPYAYNVSEDSATVTTANENATVSINVNTGKIVPAKIQVQNIGSAPIGGVWVNGIAMAGMELTSGQTLTINMESPIGATIDRDGNIENALPYAYYFPIVHLYGGVNDIGFLLSYGSGTKGARITVSGRGRW